MPKLISSALLSACVLIWAGIWTGAGQAEEAGTGKRLQDVERALEASEAKTESLDRKAEELQREIAGLQDKSIAVAEKTQDLESRLTRSETTLEDLEAKHAAKTEKLQAQHGSLYHTLAALQRMALQPSEAVLVSPGRPVERLRSALLLRTTVPAIEARATALRADLEELESLRLAIEQQQIALAATAKALAEERQLLDELIGRKTALHAQTLGARDDAETNAQRLAQEAQTLRELLARLEAQSLERAEAEQAQAEAEQALEAEPAESTDGGFETEYEETQSLAEEPGQTSGETPEETSQETLAALPPSDLARPDNLRAFPEGKAVPLLVMPVRGRLALLYGQQATGAQSISKGISIRTRFRAQVVAPFDGQIVYAGAFRGYGQILIIEHGGRYHSLLAGLDRIDAIAGQWILAGEPIGVMGSSQEQPPELYLELRHAGQPVNPLPWLATTDDKVQG